MNHRPRQNCFKEVDKYGAGARRGIVTSGAVTRLERKPDRKIRRNRRKWRSQRTNGRGRKNSHKNPMSSEEEKKKTCAEKQKRKKKERNNSYTQKDFFLCVGCISLLFFLVFFSVTPHTSISSSFFSFFFSSFLFTLLAGSVWSFFSFFLVRSFPTHPSLDSFLFFCQVFFLSWSRHQM